MMMTVEAPTGRIQQPNSEVAPLAGGNNVGSENQTGQVWAGDRAVTAHGRRVSDPLQTNADCRLAAAPHSGRGGVRVEWRRLEDEEASWRNNEISWNRSKQNSVDSNAPFRKIFACRRCDRIGWKASRRSSSWLSRC